MRYVIRKNRIRGFWYVKRIYSNSVVSECLPDQFGNLEDALSFVNKLQEKDSDLSKLIRQAEENGLIIYAPYHGIYFTPAELRIQNEEGKFLWGPSNFKLVNK